MQACYNLRRHGGDALSGVIDYLKQDKNRRPGRFLSFMGPKTYLLTMTRKVRISMIKINSFIPTTPFR